MSSIISKNIFHNGLLALELNMDGSFPLFSSKLVSLGFIILLVVADKAAYEFLFTSITASFTMVVDQ